MSAFSKFIRGLALAGYPQKLGAAAPALLAATTPAAQREVLQVGRARSAPQMVTVACGNSIADHCKFAGSYWTTKSEIHLANALSDAMRFKRMTASIRADLYGVYGYSGQTLPTILADLETQWFAPLRTAAIVPDLILGHALLENDIAGGATVAAMTKTLTQWMRVVQATWPGAIIHLVCPRPSFSYNTPTIVAAYQGIRDVMLALDNGVDVFVSRGDAYENPASPGTPLGTSGSPIYTDSSVHPNAKGALLLARVQAATLNRIASVWKCPGYGLSANIALSGTGAATGTNVSGTVPTGVVIIGSANATSFVGLAEQPGFVETITGVATTAGPGSATIDLASVDLGNLALSGVTEISPFLKVQLLSGAENLRGIQLYPHINDGGGNNFRAYISHQTGDAEQDWINGDILTLRMPSQIAAIGSITACRIYLQRQFKSTGGGCSYRLLSQGVTILS